MATMTATCSGISSQLPVVRRSSQNNGKSSICRSQPAGCCCKALPYGCGKKIILYSGTRDLTLKCSVSCLQPFGTTSEAVPFGGKRQGDTKPNLSWVCFSALNARCGAEQTQTITRESSTITVAPVDGKADLSPKIDDGGPGFPPRDNNGGGGGGGGGGNWSGGFFFFGFLAFLGLLKDREKESPYDD